MVVPSEVTSNGVIVEVRGSRRVLEQNVLRLAELCKHMKSEWRTSGGRFLDYEVGQVLGARVTQKVTVTEI